MIVVVGDSSRILFHSVSSKSSSVFSAAVLKDPSRAGWDRYGLYTEMILTSLPLHTIVIREDVPYAVSGFLLTFEQFSEKKIISPPTEHLVCRPGLGSILPLQTFPVCLRS